VPKPVRVVRLETLRHPAHPKLLLLRLFGDDGHVGLGETTYGPEAVAAYLHADVAPYLLGQDARQLDRHWTAIHRLGLAARARAAEMRALSAVDMALWDLYARGVDQPLYQVLGGLSRDRIRVYNTCAGYSYGVSRPGATDPAQVDYRAAGPYEDQHRFLTDPVGLARDLLGEGFTAMKIWPFDRFAAKTRGQSIAPEDLEAGVAPFREIRAAVGDRMEVALELHSLWNLPAAIRIGRAVAPYRPMWVEDPIPIEGAGPLAEFRRATGVPTCGSETLSTRWAFRALLEAGALDVCMFDVSWVGGISEARRLAALAETYLVPVAPHDCVGPCTLAFSVHLALNAPNALIQETVRAFNASWYREIVTQLPPIRDGYVYPPEGPGSGTTLAPAFLDDPRLAREASEL
jgi:L-alanine-DL-glutamate epimerase-like enolase superfamily enzyme